jgi:type I restriction enzyme, S subunit
VSKWEKVKLGDTGKVVTGNTPPTKNPEFYNSNDITFYKPNDLTETEVSYLDGAIAYVSELARPNIRLLPKGSVLVSCIGIIGKVGIALDECTCNQQINAIIPNPEKADSRYLAHCIVSRKGYLRNIANAPIVPIINKTQFSNVEIPLPPLETQKQIAKTLNTAAGLLAMRKQQLAKLDNLIKSTFYDMFGDPVINEKGWDVVAVGNVTDCIVPGRDKPKSFTGNMPWITTSDLVLGWYTYRSSVNIGLTESEINDVRARVIPKNSVIMCCVGDIGVTSITGNDLVMNQQLHSFQCGERINNIFLCIVLPFYKNQMSKRATTTTVLYMNKTSCNSTEIILPPIYLQTQFAEMVTKIEEQKTLVKKAIDETQHLFDSLMSEYFE